MSSQPNIKQHLWIIISIAIGFSAFMMGYSFSPFMDVGFGDKQGVGTTVEQDLMKQYQDLYSTDE